MTEKYPEKPGYKLIGSSNGRPIYVESTEEPKPAAKKTKAKTSR